jgi:hypothetical protein
VRTTITIDEQVYREAKAQAARSARTVSQVIEDAVRAALRAEHEAPERIDPLPTFGRGGVLPGVDLADRSALLDAMDAASPLDSVR